MRDAVLPLVRKSAGVRPALDTTFCVELDGSHEPMLLISEVKGHMPGD